MRLKGGRNNKNRRIKTPTAAPVSFDKFPPLFSLRNQIPNWTVDQCDDAHKVAFLDAINRRSQLKWQDLRGVNHRALGFEPLPRRVLESQRIAIPPEITEDTTILVFRCNVNVMRVLGYRHDAVFEVKWVDPHGTLYPH